MHIPSLFMNYGEYNVNNYKVIKHCCLQKEQVRIIYLFFIINNIFKYINNVFEIVHTIIER